MCHYYKHFLLACQLKRLAYYCKKDSSEELYEGKTYNSYIFMDNATLTTKDAVLDTEVLAENAKETTWIPGGKEGDLLATDIQKGTAISKDGKTTLTIMIKEQVDGPDCDGNTAGPVARGISTLGSIDTALEALGATLSSGRDTVKLTYKDAYIKCVIDEETGRIESGTWFYTVDIYIGDAQAKLAGIPANLKELTAAIDYKVVID